MILTAHVLVYVIVVKKIIKQVIGRYIRSH